MLFNLKHVFCAKVLLCVAWISILLAGGSVAIGELSNYIYIYALCSFGSLIQYVVEYQK